MAGGTPSSLDGFADHGKSEHQLDENWGCPHFRIAPYLLVGGFNHLEKYESQFGLLFSIYVKKNQTCYKSPTRLYNISILVGFYLLFLFLGGSNTFMGIVHQLQLAGEKKVRHVVDYPSQWSLACATQKAHFKTYRVLLDKPQ